MGVQGLKQLISLHEQKRGQLEKWEWLKELKNDGDTVTARLLTRGITGTDGTGQPVFDFDVYEVHKVKIEGYDRYVICMQDDCSLCRAGNPSFLRIWIPLLLEDGRKKVWARGKREILQLIRLAEEYGDLTQYQWEIRRIGDKGSSDTSYQFTAGPLSTDTSCALPARPQSGHYTLRLTDFQMIQAAAGILTLKTAQEDQ